MWKIYICDISYQEFSVNEIYSIDIKKPSLFIDIFLSFSQYVDHVNMCSV